MHNFQVVWEKIFQALTDIVLLGKLLFPACHTGLQCWPNCRVYCLKYIHLMHNLIIFISVIQNRFDSLITSTSDCCWVIREL
jgi:hypothetical protein